MSANPSAPLDGIVYYGPLYFATFISTGLYGITCMQTFFYYIHYPKDSLRMKTFVAALWALDTIHEALIVAGVYKYIMASLANPAAMMDGEPELVLQILLGTLVAVPTQGFFVYRIYVFSGKNIVAPILWAIQAIYQIVASILYVAKSFYTVDGSLHIVWGTSPDSFFTNITTSILALAAAVDVLIAMAMTFLLLRQQAANGFASTAHILQRLVMVAVNTGIWTATFAVLALVLLRALPSTQLTMVFAIPLSSLYCNTLLANLNARAYIRGEAASSPAFDDTRADKHKQSEVKFASPARHGIRRTTEVVTFVDFDRSTTSEDSA
ncbi:hypothetical protein HD554DRAFT_5812 [Boletus coccyginus]|nr:hypothetical protein HD554DRAFT_5812 [Boletus coccyginus]